LSPAQCQLLVLFYPIDRETNAPIPIDNPIQIEVVKNKIEPAYPTAEASTTSPNKLKKYKSTRSTRNSAMKPIDELNDITTTWLSWLNLL
jgi:BRCT domain type II-containing protein